MTEAPDAYRLEPIEGQLGALAATLARVSSSARRPARSASLGPLLLECMAFIEWTAPRVDPAIGGELADLQVMLSLWREALGEVQSSKHVRALLSLQAKIWSDRVLYHSGLLDSP